MSVTDVTEVVLSHERFKILHDSVGLMNAGKEYIHERLEDAFKILVDYSGWEGEIIPEMSKVFLKRNGKYICYGKKENHNEEKDRLPDLVQVCDGFKPDNCTCDRSIGENEIRSNICDGTRIVTLPLGTSSNVPAFARLHFKKTYNPTDEEIYTNNELIDSFRQTLASIILLDRHAYYDQLTDLPKRELLEKNIKQYMSLYDRDEKEFGVIFFDLDGFKSINDNHGHTMGDKLLQNVGSRLSEQVRAYDVVSRVGGDEFAGVILGERDKVKFVAERIFSKIIEPYIIDGKEYSIGASMGISYFPDQKTPEALLKEADSRMYAVKNRGKGFILNYNPDDKKLLPVIYDSSFTDGLIGNKNL